MTCHHIGEVLVDVARGEWADTASVSALEAHIAVCAACRARLARERELTAGMHALVAADGEALPSDALEQALLIEFEASRRARGLAGWRSWAAVAAMMAVTIAGVTLAWQSAGRPLDERDALARPDAIGAGLSSFVPWPGAGALPAFESGHLVRTELPASLLPLLGIEPTIRVTGDTVLADVLVGQDGLARAVRLAP
jgi:anti-sigma factor RsiW